MTYKIKGSDLGVKNCEFVAVGETPEDVLEQLVTHLRKEHDVNMPDKDVILEGEGDDWEVATEDSGAAVIVKRLQKILELDDAPAADTADDPGPVVSTRPTSG